MQQLRLWLKSIIKAFCLVLFIVVAFETVKGHNLCNRVSEIKILPFKDERVDDDAYYSLIEAGEAVLPCLISKVTDTQKMRDPRQAPRYSGIDTRVGDVAYFLVVRIAKFDFIGKLPPEVQERYKTEGVYAYFEFVQKKRNRRWLQRNLTEWYRSKDGKNVPQARSISACSCCAATMYTDGALLAIREGSTLIGVHRCLDCDL